MPTDPLPPEAVIEPLIRTLARLRPDMQCLLALPLDADAGLREVAAAAGALEAHPAADLPPVDRVEISQLGFDRHGSAR